jgi:hypothetical protein
MSVLYDLDSVWRDRSVGINTNPCDYSLTAAQIATWTPSGREITPLPKSPNQRPLDFVSSINLLGATLPYPRIELYAKNFIVIDSITAGNTLNTVNAHGLSVNDIIMTSSPGWSISNGIGRNIEYHVVAVGPTTIQVSLLQGGAVLSLTNGTGLALEVAVITPTDYSAVMANLNAALELLKYPRIYLDIHSHTYNDTRFIRTIGGVLANARFILVIDKVHYDDNLMPIWIHYRPSREQVMRFKKNDTIVIKFMSRGGTTIPFFDESDLSLPLDPEKQSVLSFDVIPYLNDARFGNHMTEPVAST